jgi:hypothetical protein
MLDVVHATGVSTRTMMRPWRYAVALNVLAAAMALAGETTRTEAAGLRFALPRIWTRVPTMAETRAAQYRLPPAPGDVAETDFAVFFHGEGQGGSATENLERWYSRFAPRDGRPSRDVAIVTTRTTGDLRVTAIDLSGTWVGSATQPTAAGISGYRLLGAVVEGKGGPWILEILGPAATVDRAKPDFDLLLSSLEAHR